MVSNVVPSITLSPALTQIPVTEPSASAVMLFSIFIASSTSTVSPFFTACPALTKILVTTPGNGALTGVPAPGPLVAAGAAAGVSAAGAAGVVVAGVASVETVGKASSTSEEPCISTSKGMPFTSTLALEPTMLSMVTSNCAPLMVYLYCFIVCGA